LFILLFVFYIFFKIQPTEEITKVLLEDIRSINAGSYILTGFVSTNGNQSVTSIKCQDSEMW